MRTSRPSSPLGNFHQPMDEIEKRHCLQDLDRLDERVITVDEFFAKWGDALRAMLQP